MRTVVAELLGLCTNSVVWNVLDLTTTGTWMIDENPLADWADAMPAKPIAQPTATTILEIAFFTFVSPVVPPLAKKMVPAHVFNETRITQGNVTRCACSIASPSDTACRCRLPGQSVGRPTQCAGPVKKRHIAAL